MKKIKIILIIVVLIIAIIFIARLAVSIVEKTNVKTDLSKINEIFNYSIKEIGWQIDLYSADENYKYVNLSKELDDTSKILNYFYYEESGIYQIDCYQVNYKGNKFEHQIRIEKDTLYHYKVSIDNPNDKIFLVGQYYYLYSNNLLNPKQKKYFEQNKDSLTKVRGNDLSDSADMLSVQQAK